MAVSILTLKTGDRVIAELKEIFDGEGDDKRGVCLLMEEPYVLSLDGGNPQYLLNSMVWNTKSNLVSGILILQTGNSRCRMIVS